MNTNYEFLIPVHNISELNSILDHLTDNLGIEYTVNNSEPTNETYKEMIEYIINFYYNESGNEILKKYPNKIYAMMYGKSNELLNDHFTDIILIETKIKENIMELETFLNIQDIGNLILNNKK